MLFYRFFILYGYAVFLNHAAPVSFQNILNSASPYVAEETDCAAVISTVPMVFPSNVYVRVPMTSPSFTGAVTVSGRVSCFSMLAVSTGSKNKVENSFA